MPLWLTLNVLQLKILKSLQLLGKCFAISRSNALETFVETDLLKGGLKYIMFCFHDFGFSDLLLVNFKSTLQPNFFVFNYGCIKNFLVRIFQQSFRDGIG